MPTQILVSDDVELETSLPLRDAPRPSGQHGNVHAFGAHNSEPSLVTGLADVGPPSHVVFLSIVVARPEESRLHLCDLMVQGLMEAVEAHKKQEEVSEGGINEDRPSRL